MSLYVLCTLMARYQPCLLTLPCYPRPAVGRLSQIYQRKETGHPLRAWDFQPMSLLGHRWCPFLHSDWHHTPVTQAGLHPPLALGA